MFVCPRCRTSLNPLERICPTCRMSAPLRETYSWLLPLAVFLAPLTLVVLIVVGFRSTWRRQDWDIARKCAATAVLACAGVLAAVMISKLSYLLSDRPIAIANAAVAPVPPATLEGSTPEQSAAYREKIQALMKQRFGPRLRGVEIAAAPTGGYTVQVKFNMVQGPTADAVKTGIEAEMREVYRDLFVNHLDIRQAGVAAYGPVQDGAGDTFDAIIYMTGLTAEAANTIDWKNGASDLNQAWTVYALNPVLRPH